MENDLSCAYTNTGFEYDLAALAFLIVGIAAVGLLVIII
jgi:hypothetical protein